jgi:hypothetical protein
VEHKGLGCAAARFGWFLLAALALLAGCISKKCIPVGMRRRFLDFRCPKVPPPFPYKLEGHDMAQRAIRFSETTDEGIREATEKRGFSSPTAFIRHAVEQELSGQREELVGAEARLAASIERVRQDMVPLDRAQKALFALVDRLAKILLTCIPEPDGHMLAAAVARAQGRHARLLKSAGHAMGDDSRRAMRELVKNGER